MRYFGVTDKGLIRKNNQDNYIVSYNMRKDVLVIVCDGIGGNNAGDIASYEAITYFSDIFSQNDGFDNIDQAKIFIHDNVDICNKRMLKMANDNVDYHGMGTTFVGVLLINNQLLAFNIGDSRVYTLKDDTLEQISMDHNFSNEMLSKGVTTKEKMENHPKRHYLTRALGVSENIECDFFEITNMPQYILVSSDGLHGYVSDELIEKILADKVLSVLQKTNTLLEAALKSGGYDNITIVLLEMSGDDYGN